jgi:hypothetical protein
MGVVLDQFEAIPSDTLPQEWAEMKEYSFGERRYPQNTKNSWGSQ